MASIGFPPYHEERIILPASPEAISAEVVPTCMSLGWSCFAVDTGVFSASSPWRVFISYGETIRIVVDSESGVFVRSECVMPLQWLDWGVNSGNVHRFFAALDQRLAMRYGAPLKHPIG